MFFLNWKLLKALKAQTWPFSKGFWFPNDSPADFCQHIYQKSAAQQGVFA